MSIKRMKIRKFCREDTACAMKNLPVVGKTRNAMKISFLLVCMCKNRYGPKFDDMSNCILHACFRRCLLVVSVVLANTTLSQKTSNCIATNARIEQSQYMNPVLTAGNGNLDAGKDDEIPIPSRPFAFFLQGLVCLL